VVKLHEEFFLPGEVILEQGTVVDQIYIVAHGCLVLLAEFNNFITLRDLCTRSVCERNLHRSRENRAELYD
jgi:hypothetical protein